MNAKLAVGAKSTWKYLAWTAVAAGVVAVIDLLPGVQLPPWAIPILGAILKGLASFAATEAQS